MLTLPAVSITMEAPSATAPLFIDCHRLNLDAVLPEHAERCLSPEERQRAARFRFEHLQRHYRACRIGLRHLLASRLGIDPAEIGFELGPYGKPRLAARHGSGLHFNLSNSGNVAWIALADVPVGIDLELTGRSLPDRSALSQRVASSAEQAAMQAMPGEQRSEIFLLAWTRKEALLKAWGRGIGGLDSLQSLDTRLPAPESLHTFLQASQRSPEPNAIEAIEGMASLSPVEIRLPKSCDTSPPRSPQPGCHSATPGHAQASEGTAPAPRVNAPVAGIVEHGWAEDDAPPVFWLNSFYQGQEMLSLAAPLPFQVRVQRPGCLAARSESALAPLSDEPHKPAGEAVART